ncbi:hypothetical protein PGTUg99_008610 [Puccinia graminis f. sp. tritici]|uniref:Uncharacterized protein n=1 Tax=Puccinia graminis f. sp. tritici TaxID=56615 RepID=A0A5B0PVH9_PUCGR|nr:hypothetical protein PGTUg99_008610 [Puccinia graminis f. sp. tritici]
MMHILFNVTLVTSLHVNLVLGSFGLDPKAVANAAPEESRQLAVVEGNHQHSSLLHLHPDSSNDALQTSDISPPQAPSRIVPLSNFSGMPSSITFQLSPVLARLIQT